MTVLDHTVKLGSPTGGAGTGDRQYTATLYVESDDCNDTGHAVLEYVIGEGFDYGKHWAFGNDENKALRLFQIEPPQYIPGSAYKWMVTLRYQQFSLSVPITTTTIDPTDFLPEISLRNVGRTRTVEKGVYLGGLLTNWTVDEERTITNSANTPFVPAVEAEFHDQIIRVVRRTAAVIDNETNFPTDWINSNKFTISNGYITREIEPFTMRFAGWDMDREKYEGYDVVRVEFAGEIKKSTWITELLDIGVLVDTCEEDEPRHDGRGSYGYPWTDPVNVAPQRAILDRSGIPAGQPEPLDGKGNVAQKCSKDRFYGRWRIYDAIDPTALGFFAGITSVPPPPDP